MKIDGLEIGNWRLGTRQSPRAIVQSAFVIRQSVNLQSSVFSLQLLFQSDDAKEGIMANLDKRKAAFKGK